MRNSRIDTHRQAFNQRAFTAILLVAFFWFGTPWLFFGPAWAAEAPEAAQSEAMQVLAAELVKAGEGFELGTGRTLEPRNFYMETRLTHYEPDGTRSEGVTFRFWLELTPDGPEGDPGALTVVCRKFTIVRPGGREVELPTLRDWTYRFSGVASGIDEKGQVFGIPHEKFAFLVDAKGDVVESGTGYLVYNAFIDFHGFNDVLAINVGEEAGGGIQDLRRIGDVIEHAASETEPPVGLGEAMKKGSFFKNGKVTLELKGVSLVDGRPCALLGYDSGESSYLMYLEPMDGMDLKAVGASHYFGDLHVELGSGWLRKATLFELVVSEAQTGKGEPENTIIERQIDLVTLTEDEMEKL